MVEWKFAWEVSIVANEVTLNASVTRKINYRMDVL